MKNFESEGTSNVPYINFSVDGKFIIKGISTSQVASRAFAEVIEWLENFLVNPPPEITLEIYLRYFNTSSSKLILRIMLKLAEAAKQKNISVKIKWYYETEDIDMYEAGIDYEHIVKLPFEHIPVNN